MYHPPSKRKQIIRRVIIYGLMSIAVVVVVVVLVFVMLGYQLNRSDGKIEQGGLVQFDSKPSGANVTIDGANFGTRTASKTTMTSGPHFVTMERDGYKTWQKSINVVPGSVLWLSYVRLIPKEITPANVASFSALSSTATSPDDKWMALKEDPASATIHLADLSQDTPKFSNIELPSDSFTHPTEGKTQSFSLEKWDPDSRYILTKHTYDDAKVEWLVVDTQNVALTKNVTKLLDIDASKLVFSGNNSTILYAQIGADVRKIDLGAATLSRPLVTNVAEFSLFDDTTVAYTTLFDPSTKTRSVGYYEDGADQAHTIRSYTDDGQQSLHVAIGKYFSEPYVAIAHGTTVTVLKGKLPGDTGAPSSLAEVSTMTLPTDVQYLSDVTDGRFVVAQAGALYQTYDIELKKTTKTELKTTTNPTKELAWLDDYTLWSDQDGMLRFYEFDGANQNNIMPVATGFSVTLSPNSKYVYGIAKSSDGKYQLERAKLLLS